jgi:beta-fructofuranosidase
LSNSGSTGLVLAQDAISGNGVKIAFEPQNNKLAAYLINNGTEEVINQIPLVFDTNHIYKIIVTISNDVCTLYIDDKIAFTNRIYNVNGKKWSIFSGNNSPIFSNIIIKNPK